VLPSLVAAKAPGDPVRIWSAGCASGEESYSLAVLLADAFGEDRFRQSVKIYATDADNEALAEARHGRYPFTSLDAAFGEDRALRYFERDGDYGVFRGDLRRALIFGRHDLVQDPPISRIDLLTCRNTLMYFTAEVQGKILRAACRWRRSSSRTSSRRWCWTPAGPSCWPTARRGGCSPSAPPSSAVTCARRNSRTGPPICAPWSSGCSASGAR